MSYGRGKEERDLVGYGRGEEEREKELVSYGRGGEDREKQQLFLALESVNHAWC